MNEKDQDLALCEAQHSVDVLERRVNELATELQIERAANKQVQAVLLDYIVNLKASLL
ncbi:MAG: hypothetical protein WCL08_13025 [Verrucomicrobiota bacterium]